MSNKPPFAERLRIGQSIELAVMKWLVEEKSCHVIPTCDFSQPETDKPVMFTGKRKLVLPDLDVSGPLHRYWLEVKGKDAPSYTRITGREEHGLAWRMYRDYLEVERLTGNPVYLFVYEMSSGRAMCQSLAKLSQHVRRYGSDKMDYGGMAFFPRDEFFLLDEEKINGR